MCRSSRPEVFIKKVYFENSAKFLILQKVASLQPDALLRKTPAQVFSYDFRKIFESIILTELPWATASKCNATFKELFSLLHRTFKCKHCLNVVSTWIIFL